MKWYECPDGSLFNIEETLDIRIIMDKEKPGIYHLKAFFPLILSTEKSSMADSITVTSGTLDICKAERSKIKEKLASAVL